MAAPPTCLKCGYLLRGNADGICPECGNAYAVVDPVATQRQRLESRRSYWVSLAISVIALTTVTLVAPAFHGKPVGGTCVGAFGIGSGAVALWYAYKSSKSPTRAVMALAWLPALLAVFLMVVSAGLTYGSIVELTRN